MLLNSRVFIFAFLPITILGFYYLSIHGGPKPAKLWLVVASFIYYGWWNPIYIALIIPSILFNFWYGKLLWNTRPNPFQNKLLLAVGLSVNLLLLCYFKYANFFVDNVNACLGTSWTFEKLILPLGISFFTFQQVAYLVDASRGVACEGDLPDYVLFITFFPHLIAGPITHHTEMMPQFARSSTYRLQWDNMAIGLTLFAIGLFKKVIVADGLSGHVVKIFGAASTGHALHSSDAWAGVMAYAFQIYFDFSGYSDMALGLARMFGIILPLNFHSPYQATNIVDFWRRWHITLSRCLRNYIYIPLGGNRQGSARRHLNLMLTMLIGGLWHGAAWTFVIWGFLHGLYLALNHLYESWAQSLPAAWRLPNWLSAWLGRGLTFFLVLIGWVFFRAAKLEDAQIILNAMFGLGPALETGQPWLLKSKLWIWLIGLLGLVWLAPNATEVTHQYNPALITYPRTLSRATSWLEWRVSWPWVGFTAAMIVGAVLCLSRTGEFLYYNF